jgi:hypothetical protein
MFNERNCSGSDRTLIRILQIRWRNGDPDFRRPPGIFKYMISLTLISLIIPTLNGNNAANFTRVVEMPRIARKTEQIDHYALKLIF